MKSMTPDLKLLFAAALLTGPGIAAAQQDSQDSIGAAIAGGSPYLELRYRYEFVDQASFDDNANASTLLLRLNYETGAWNNWSGFVEFDEVMEVLLDDFNSGAGTSSDARDRYPVVADPAGSDLNQFYLQFAPGSDWRTRIGRQRILLDDQRFVGGVGWRQNEQTFDGLTVKYGLLENTSIFYGYVANVNRIYGSEAEAPQGDHKGDTHLLNVNVKATDKVGVVGYAYLIDNADSPTFSTNTFGLRGNAQVGFADGKLDLLGEFALQSDAGDSPADFDANYFRLQGIWSAKALSAGVGIESLGSDNGQGFRTPLATLHLFNGWADQFLATPGDGLVDLYLNLGYKASGWNLQFVYHDLSADVGSADYGSEIDLAASRKFGDRYDLLLKAASFDADGPGFVDTTKIWVMFTAAY